MSTKRKLRVGILFGGKSAEHEVSLQTAKNVVEAIDKNKYEVVLIGIDKKGQWHLGSHSQFLLNENNPKLIKLHATNTNLTLLPYETDKQLVDITANNQTSIIDIVFPLLHGPYGEDGTVQGLLKLANIPFVGCDVLGSAIGMDKDVMKRLLKEEDIPVAKFVVLTHSNVILSPKDEESYTRSFANAQDDSFFDFNKIVKTLGLPFFVKPANLGSSVGVSKVHSEEEFERAIHHAFSYDKKILIEEAIQGREIECSVLGNENPLASLPGEIVVHDEFYSYEAKYINENGATLQIPADIPQGTIKKVQDLAIKTFQTLCCEGMARVDMFLKPDGTLVINEINTIPGFTKISMYPKLWEASGISYKELIDRLIQLAIERHERDKKLKTTYLQG